MIDAKRLVESRSSDVELAAAFVENRRAELKDRIVPFLLRFDPNGEPEFPCDRSTILGKAEYEGMQNMRSLAQLGHNYIVWASPEGGRSNYNDGSRLVVGCVASRYGGVTIECRGIVLKNDSPEELLAMVKKLQENGAVAMDEIRSPEDLREQALAIKVSDERELWNIMEMAFGHSEIWDEIRHNRDVINKMMAQKMIARFRNSPEAAFASTFGDIWWGVGLERFMARNGYEITGGNHGVTNTSLVDGKGSPFDKLFSMTPNVSSENLDSRLEYCVGCGNYFIKRRGSCPKCKG